MKPLFLALPGNEAITKRLAAALDGEVCAHELRDFPDAETYLRLDCDPRGRTAILVCTLSHPNGKFLPLIFAAATLRELGARRIGLVAPYLAYMRQDCRFRPGEAVTSRIFAGLISRSFDWLVTVDPHLHRYTSLADIYSIPCRALHAGPAIAEWIRNNVDHPFLIGPDAESRQWVAAVAVACGAGYDVLEKSRLGDRSVTIGGAGLAIPAQATPILLDDIVSSGATMIEAVATIRQHMSSSILAVAIHALDGARLAIMLGRTDVQLATTNTIPNPCARIDITALLADGLAEFV